MNTRSWVNRLLASSVLPVVLAAAHAASAAPLADSVREALDRFKDPAVAQKEGYSPGPCVAGQTGGAMGIHFVNVDYLKNDDVDLAKPEAVMYEPKPDGKLELVGVEYITFKGPAALEGHLFSYNSAPNRYGLDAFYELHVWAWKDNPTGTFADWNPKVSCDAITPEQAASGRH